MKLYTNIKTQWANTQANVKSCWRCVVGRWLASALIVAVVVVWALRGFV